MVWNIQTVSNQKGTFFALHSNQTAALTDTASKQPTRFVQTKVLIQLGKKGTKKKIHIVTHHHALSYLNLNNNSINFYKNKTKIPTANLSTQITLFSLSPPFNLLLPHCLNLSSPSNTHTLAFHHPFVHLKQTEKKTFFMNKKKLISFENPVNQQAKKSFHFSCIRQNSPKIPSNPTTRHRHKLTKTQSILHCSYLRFSHLFFSLSQKKIGQQIKKIRSSVSTSSSASNPTCHWFITLLIVIWLCSPSTHWPLIRLHFDSTPHFGSQNKPKWR